MISTAPTPTRRRYPLTLEKACNALYLVNVAHLSQTQTALLLGLNVGQVCHVINRRRFPQATPIEPGRR